MKTEFKKLLKKKPINNKNLDEIDIFTCNIEVFKDIPGYKGHYQVSNFGSIKSFKNNKWGLGGNKILKKHLLNGYNHIDLKKNNKRKILKIHRLVLLTFIGKSELDCNHINGIKTDNMLYNLEYCTKSENIQHAIRTGLLKVKKVKQYTKSGEFIKTWNSAKEISIELGIHITNLSLTCSGKQKTSGGYKWKYIN